MDLQPEEKVYQAALAGLLHDIGKFAQRAGERGRLESSEARREYGYYHAMLSSDAVAKLVPERWRASVMAAVGNHHRPQKDLDFVIQLADHLSSGEREEDEDNRVPYLQSLFCTMRGYADRRFYPLKALEPESEFIYPYRRESTWKEDHRGEYERLWQEFTKEVKQLSSDSLQAYLEGLLDLFQRYTWCIPSAFYKNVPDVSLYDHSRMTGALAACMAADDREAGWCEAIRKDLSGHGKATENEVALLVGGDISGIQDYLYTISSGGAASSLRGRSFYLQLLTEAVALAYLEALHLPLTNLIYAGGGHFYLLAPTRKETQETLKALQTRLAQVLLDAHEGRLYLAVGVVPVTAGRLMGGAFKDLWRELHVILNRDKRRRFAALGAAVMAQEIGVPLGYGGDPLKYCLVCGREDDGRSMVAGERKCSFCESLERLGIDLRTTSALLVSTVPPIRKPVQTWRDGLQALGLEVTLVQEETSKIVAPEGAALVRVWHLREELAPAVVARTPVVTARHFLALAAPRMWDHQKEEVRIAMFDDLANASKTGLKRWGVLRMDVDDLGNLFQEGLGERASISRMATLSFMLRLFFEGHLPALVKKYNHFDPDTHQNQDQAYVMYAGGDDLFIVGSWEILPELAYDIRNAFGDFVAGNPKITLSAGISIHSEKYPLYIAAQEAGKALDEGAKSFQRENKENKNALSFLNAVIGWEEYPEIYAQVQAWKEWIGSKVAAKSDISRLRQVANQYRQEWEQAFRERKIKRGQHYLGPWAWRLVYRFSRRREQAEKKSRRCSPELVQQYKGYISALDNLEDALIKRGAIRTVGLLARWAEFLTREEKVRGANERETP